MGSHLGWGGLEIFVSETLYRKGNLNIKNCARVHFRDNLAENYSRDLVLGLCSALFEVTIPS